MKRNKSRIKKTADKKDTTNTRNTIQRTKILDFLKKNRSHPTAEDIFREIKKEIPTITLATVYRNLHILAEQNKILRFEINKEYHFDAETRMHFHFLCRNSNRIIDIFPDDSKGIINAIKKEIKKEIKNKKYSLELENWQSNAIQIFMFGECK